MKLIIVTTVPETLATILRGQPAWLEKHVSVTCISSPGPMLDMVVRNESVAVFQVSMNRGISPFKDVVSIFRMWRVLRKLKPDVVHSYTPKAGLIAMVAGFLAGVRVRVHTFTGLVFPTSSGLKRSVLIAIDRLICVVATHVVPEGRGVAEDLRNNRITSKALDVIGNGNIAGVDVKYFHPNIIDPLELPYKDTFIFGFVGRLNRDKGLQELVSAFLSLEGDPALLLVGDLDSTAPVDSGTLSQIESHPRIHATGFLEDIRPGLVACDVLVLASYREGFPNVVLQAGAMGKPVIASDINGCNEVIENGFNGWLVPPGNSKVLAERLLCAMNVPSSEIERLGRNARERIVERYEQGEYRQKLLEFYREITNEAKL